LKGELSVPDDVWLVDLDANKVYPPANGEELPPLPEVESATLRSHIEQVRSVNFSVPLYGNVENKNNKNNALKNFLKKHKKNRKKTFKQVK
jgi:hypothetical protein